MSLQANTNISVDFNDNKYIMINAKQLDSGSRLIAVTCYNQGSIMNLTANKHTAYVRYRKADGYRVFNNCRINYKGEVLVELTEQMLAADGICYVDLVIVEKGKAIVNIDTGEIITIDESPILSTMAFCVNVYEATVDNSLIESSYEYDGLNDLLQRADADYSEVIRTAKSYAIGEGDMRDNEEIDNAKYYQLMSRSYAMGDTKNIRENENTDNSKYYMNMAKSHMNDTKSHMDTTKSYMDTTKSHMDTTKNYMDTVEEYMDTTNGYMAKTEEYMDATESYMNNTNDYMGNALDYANTSKRYAVGGTGTVDGEDSDNSEYYYKLARSYTKGDISLRTDEDKDNAEYYYKLAKSYTVGNTGLDERVDENEDNAKYYYQLAKVEASNTVETKNTVQTYMDNTQSYMNNAKTYMDNSKTYMDNASVSADSADISKTNAAESANRAADVADSIVDSVKSVEDNAKIASDSAISALENAENASESATSASNSATSASESATSALKNYEETNYLYLQTKEITVGLNGAFSPMGTIEFSDLATLLEGGEVKVGYLYNISDAFVTDDTFKRAGIECVAGSNVYLTSDGYWDCLTAGTVNGVKGDNELEFRQGNVNITAENVGAIPSADIATVDEIKSYLGI